VRNAALSALRSRRRRRDRERLRAAERREAFEARPGDLVDARTAQRLLAALPEEQREVVVLRVWGGLTLQETSDVTGRPVTTVFRRYRTGLAAIREGMESSCRKTN
jgi:RNA polymerase sigma-70 factor (ECF subfamily)